MKECKLKSKNPVTTERCNEMISELESAISFKFGVPIEEARYKGKEREALIKEIKENPTHCWWVGERSLMHANIKDTIMSGVFNALKT